MQTGALITAAGKRSEMTAFRPMLKLNGGTLIQKEIDTLRRANISPIVVVTGYAAEELERHLAHRGVICVRNEAYQDTQMLDSVKLGLKALKNRCDRVVFLPVDAPMFSVQSLERVMASQADAAIPQCQGKNGHPIMIGERMIDRILNYQGENGMKGAIAASGLSVESVEVTDPGILMEVHDEEAYQELLQYEQDSIENTQMICEVSVDLKKGERFFYRDTAEFLERIDEVGSMLAACKEMGMAYSRGWKMVKTAEESMGFPFLEKRAGGSAGGNSLLTDKGRDFLLRYRKLEAEVERMTENLFREYFDDSVND